VSIAGFRAVGLAAMGEMRGLWSFFAVMRLHRNEMLVLLSDRDADVSRLGPAGLTNVVWAITMLDIRSPRAMDAAADASVRLMGRFRACDLSRMLWAYATWELSRHWWTASGEGAATHEHCSGETLEKDSTAIMVTGEFDTNITGSSEHSSPQIDIVSQRGSSHYLDNHMEGGGGGILVGNYFSGSGKNVNEPPDYKGAAKTEGGASAHGLGESRSGGMPSDCADTCRSDAEHRAKSDIALLRKCCRERLGVLVDAISAEILKKIDGFEAQDLSNTAWALATLRANTAARDAIAQECVSKIDSFGPTELSNIAWAFALLHDAPTHECMPSLGKHPLLELPALDGWRACQDATNIDHSLFPSSPWLQGSHRKDDREWDCTPFLQAPAPEPVPPSRLMCEEAAASDVAAMGLCPQETSFDSLELSLRMPPLPAKVRRQLRSVGVCFGPCPNDLSAPRLLAEAPACGAIGSWDLWLQGGSRLVEPGRLFSHCGEAFGRVVTTVRRRGYDTRSVVGHIRLSAIWSAHLASRVGNGCAALPLVCIELYTASCSVASHIVKSAGHAENPAASFRVAWEEALAYARGSADAVAQGHVAECLTALDRLDEAVGDGGVAVLGSPPDLAHARAVALMSRLDEAEVLAASAERNDAAAQAFFSIFDDALHGLSAVERAAPLGRRLRLGRVRALVLTAPEAAFDSLAASILEELAALVADGESPELHHWQGLALLRMGRRSEACETLSLLAGWHPPSREVLAWIKAAKRNAALGHAALQRGNWEEAARHCSAVAAGGAGARFDTALVAGALSDLAWARRRLGEHAQALLDVEAALALRARHGEARLRRGVLRLEAGDVEAAATDLELAGHYDPDLREHTQWLQRAQHWSWNPPNKNHYTLLGVRIDASDAEIRHAYQTLALRHHPDKAGLAAGSQRFLEVRKAWEVLSDPVSRRQFDGLDGHSHW